MKPEQLSEEFISLFMRIDKLNMYRNVAPKLTMSETDILMELYFYDEKYHEALTIKGLSNAFQIKSSTTIQFVNALEREGYVTRQTLPQDKRVTLVVLTEYGREVASLVDTDHQQVMKRLLEKHGDTLKTSLKVINEAIDMIEAIPLKQISIERNIINERN